MRVDHDSVGAFESALARERVLRDDPDRDDDGVRGQNLSVTPRPMRNTTPLAAWSLR
jgi:hypothetical protein